MKFLEAKTNLEQARQSLESLERELPRYQKDAAETALQVAQAKSAKVERKTLSKLMTEANAAAALLDQQTEDITRAKDEAENAQKQLTRAEKSGEIEALARVTNEAVKGWHEETLTINNLLELAERNAVRASEHLKTMLESRIMFAEKMHGVLPREGTALISELNQHHDLSSLLLAWPNTPLTPYDGLIGEEKTVLRMPGSYKNQIWGLLEISAKKAGLPSLSQHLEITVPPPRRGERVAASKPEPREQSDWLQMSDEEAAELLHELHGESEEQGG